MESIKELKEICMKKDKCDSIVKFYRVTSLYITKLLLYTPITANHVSFSIFILAFIIFGLFSFGEYWYSIIGIILLHLILLLDCVDGKIARYRKTASIKGRFFDLITHSILESFVFFGLTWGIYKNTGNFMFLFFGIVAALFAYLAPSIHYLKNHVMVMKLIEYSKGRNLEELENKKFEILDGETRRRIGFLKRIIKKLISFLTPYYLTLILTFSIIFNFTQWVLVFYGIVLPLKWFIIMINELKIGYKPLEYLFKPYKPK